MTIGNTIKMARKQLGLTQEDIANHLQISTAAVSKWENDLSYPDICLLTPLARYLHINMNTLFSFHEELSEDDVKRITKGIISNFKNMKFADAISSCKQVVNEYPDNVALYS